MASGNTHNRLKLGFRSLGAGLLGLLLVGLWLWLATIPVLASNDANNSSLFWQGQADLARRALATDHTNLDHLFMLATAQAMLGFVEESMATFDVLIEQGADDAYAQVIIDRYGDNNEFRDNLLVQSYLAFAYYVGKDYRKSVTAFDAVIRLDPSNPWPLNYQGFSLYKCDELDKAVTALKISVHLQPHNEYTHMLLGMAYYEQGHYLKALGEFSKAPGAIKKIFR